MAVLRWLIAQCTGRLRAPLSVYTGILRAMGPIYSVADFLDMVRRRLGLISFVFILGCFGSVIFAISQPHLYQSSEVIQIEQPKIANDLAPSTVEGSAARRLQLIEQQLMARGTLNEIIAKFGLYANLAALRPSEKVDLLRRSVTISGVAAVREGFADDGAIAVLTITAEMDNGQLAQQVAHEFADRTRTLASNQRQEQTRETLEFFQQQENNLMLDLAGLEDALVKFRNDNNLSVEGGVEFRRSELASLNDALLELDREIIAAQLAISRLDRTGRASTVAREEAELEGELDSLRTQRELLQQRRTALNESLQTSPETERALAEFERRRDQLQGQLDIIAVRRNEAEVGFSLESADRGERLITLEEAQVPDYPVTASRKNRAIMGAMASVVLGLVLAFLMELRKPVIRTAAQMQRETGLLPVISIPQTSKPKKRSGLSKLWQDRSAAGRRGRAARMARKT